MINFYSLLIDGIFAYIVKSDWLFLLICMSLVLAIVYILKYAIWGSK